MKVLLSGLFGTALKTFLKGLKIIAVKTAKKAFWIALIVFGLGLVGLLPPSPFRVLNNFIASETVQASEILRYLPVFVPVHEIIAFTGLWAATMAGVWVIKSVLKATSVI